MEALVEHVELLRERWLALRGTPVGAGAALATPVLQVEVDGERDGFDGHLQVRRRDARVGHHQSARRRAPPQQTSHCRRKTRVCPSPIRVICTYTVEYSCERAVVVRLTYRAYSDLSACQCVHSGEQVFFDRIYKQNFILEKQYGDRRQISYVCEWHRTSAHFVLGFEQKEGLEARVVGGIIFVVVGVAVTDVLYNDEAAR